MPTYSASDKLATIVYRWVGTVSVLDSRKLPIDPTPSVLLEALASFAVGMSQ